MSNTQSIHVEVAYALPQKQKILGLQVQPGTTAYEAVLASGITDDFPDLDIADVSFGIFGQVLGTKGLAGAHEYLLQAGDRVEIYRPLIADPKEARRKRAAKTKS